MPANFSKSNLLRLLWKCNEYTNRNQWKTLPGIHTIITLLNVKSFSDYIILHIV